MDGCNGLAVWLRALVKADNWSGGGAIRLPRLDPSLVLQGWNSERKCMQAEDDAPRGIRFVHGHFYTRKVASNDNSGSVDPFSIGTQSYPLAQHGYTFQPLSFTFAMVLLKSHDRADLR